MECSIILCVLPATGVLALAVGERIDVDTERLELLLGDPPDAIPEGSVAEMVGTCISWGD